MEGVRTQVTDCRRYSVIQFLSYFPSAVMRALTCVTERRAGVTTLSTFHSVVQDFERKKT